MLHLLEVQVYHKLKRVQPEWIYLTEATSIYLCHKPQAVAIVKLGTEVFGLLVQNPFQVYGTLTSISRAEWQSGFKFKLAVNEFATSSGPPSESYLAVYHLSTHNLPHFVCLSVGYKGISIRSTQSTASQIFKTTGNL